MSLRVRARKNQRCISPRPYGPSHTNACPQNNLMRLHLRPIKDRRRRQNGM
jgi:hypothetical protein